MEEKCSFASRYARPTGCPCAALLTSTSGVFLVNSDSAILLAMFRQIASDFDRLSSSSWIITAYLLGLISAQPLVRTIVGHVNSCSGLEAHDSFWTSTGNSVISMAESRSCLAPTLVTASVACLRKAPVPLPRSVAGCVGWLIAVCTGAPDSPSGASF